MACSCIVALPTARPACRAPATRGGRHAAVRPISTGMMQRRPGLRLARGKSTVVRAADAEGNDAKKTVDALDSLLAGEEEKPKQEAFYVDEKEDGDLDGAFIYRKEMSMEQKKKLRDEYVSLGGSAGTAMGANYFLWISVVIGVLAVLTWLQGGI